MKLKAIRNTKGEVVATFAAEEKGAVAPTVKPTRGFTVKSIELKADELEDPRALYVKLNKKK